MLMWGAIGALLGVAIAAYIENAIDWFHHIWDTHPDFRRNCKAVGVLVKHYSKAIKKIFLLNSSCTAVEETYYAAGDEGEEISNLDLPSEVEQKLRNDGWIVIEKHGF